MDFDLSSVWTTAVSYVEGLDGMDPYINAVDNPWTVVKGPFDMFEDRFNVVAVDVVSWTQEEERGSSTNYCQKWRVEMPLVIAALGYSREHAEDQCLKVAAVLVNAHLGSTTLGVAKDTYGIQGSSLNQGRWFVTERSDQFIAACQMILTVYVHVSQDPV